MRTLFSRCVQAGAAGTILTRRPGCGSEITLPAAGSVLVVSGTPFGTMGAWTLLQAGLATDTYLTRIVAARQTVPAVLGNAVVEWGYGTIPAVNALDALRTCEIITDAAGDDIGRYITHINTFNTLLAAGQDLDARVSEAAAAANWRVWAVGWAGAVPDFTPLDVKVPTGIGRYYPSNTSGGLNVACGAIPAYGAWVQVVAAAPNDMLIEQVVGAYSAGGVTANSGAFQIGIGAAGAEVDVGTFIVQHQIAQPDIEPPVWVKAGERVAIRGATPGGAPRFMLVKVKDL